MAPFSRIESASDRSDVYGKARVVTAVVCVLIATALVAFGLSESFDSVVVNRWSVVASVALAVGGGIVVMHSRAVDDAFQTPAAATGFGLANRITVARAVLLAWVAGFLFVPWLGVGGVVAWAPAVLYGLAAALDAVDGAVARRLDQTTALGARLDMSFDAFGLVVAPLVGVVAGQLPWWYLSVSVARYVFVAGIRLREFRELAVAPLPPRRSRRTLAGVQMAFVAVALTPLLSSFAGRIGATLFGGALLAGFVRDWLYVSGRLVKSEGHIESDEEDGHDDLTLSSASDQS